MARCNQCTAIGDLLVLIDEHGKLTHEYCGGQVSLEPDEIVVDPATEREIDITPKIILQVVNTDTDKKSHH